MWHRILFTAITLAAVISLRAASAAEPDSVKRPYVEVGDCWSYRTENINNYGPIGDYDMCVSLVDSSKNVIFAVATRKSDGREFDLSFDTVWTPRTSIVGFIISGEGSFLKFPLRVGDTHSFEYETRRPNEIQVLGRSKWDVRVVGWEEVTVPAGKFRALKVEGVGTGFASEGKVRSWPQTFTSWYVPEVNNFVKQRFQRPGLQWGEELIGYRPKP